MGFLDVLTGLFGGEGQKRKQPLGPGNFDPDAAKRQQDPEWQSQNGFWITDQNDRPVYMPGSMERTPAPIPAGYPSGYTPSDYKPFSAVTSDGVEYNPGQDSPGGAVPAGMGGGGMSPGFNSSLGDALGFISPDAPKSSGKTEMGILPDIANIIGLLQYRNAMKRHTAWLQDVAKNPRYPGWLMQDWAEQGSAGGQGKYWENYQNAHPGGQGLPTRPVAPQPQPKPKQ